MTSNRSEQTAAFLRRQSMQAGSRGGLPRALNEECGVFGVIGAGEEASSLVALGLHALQHRGQEACGITTYDGEQYTSEKHLGLVATAFTEAPILDKLRGGAGIGHTRYSTTGGAGLRNVQPLYADLDRGGLAVAHNGNLTNAMSLRADLIRKGSIFHTTSDSELFLQLAAASRGMSMIDKVTDSLMSVEGAYGLVVLTEDALIGARDPRGIRPLVLGKLHGATVLASETCAFDLIGAELIREVEPGEMVVCREDGTIESRRVFASQPARPCIFELIYFARPNSFLGDESVYALRQKLGKRLAEEAPANADLVSPIPDSGVAAAIGYAARSGLPYEMALIRSHYSGRTFIEPSQKIREAGVARKHSANRGVVEGKRVVLIDDSLVRGTTSRKITAMLREAGAKEVHFRIACPPIEYPDFYGIDTPSRAELMAANHDVEEMTQLIGADSLAFLSLGGLYEALGKGSRNAASPAFTDHCFTGDYPTPLADQERASRSATIAQLSLLREPG